MVTWMELLTFCLVVIAVIELTRSERAKKVNERERSYAYLLNLRRYAYMVTWMELLTFCLVVIAVIELTRSERAKKNDEARSYERAFFASAQ